MRQILHFLFCGLGIAANCGCASQFNIDGNSTIAGLDGQKLYLRTMNIDGQRKMVCLDSCEVVHGCFRFGGAVDSVFMADLYMGNEPMMPVVIENGSVFVQMDNTVQSISGGPLNARLNDFLVKYGRYEYELWDLNRRARNMVYEGKSFDQIVASVDPIKNSLVSKMRNLEVQFVKDNYDNVLGPGYFIRMAETRGRGALTNDLYDILLHAPDAFLNHPFVENYIVMSGLSPEKIKQERVVQERKKASKRRERKEQK